MSASTYVLAIRKLTDEDFKRILVYNYLIEFEYEIPKALITFISSILESEYKDGEPVKLPKKEQIFESRIKTVWDDGHIVDLSNLPPSTIALRIYRE